MKFNLDTLVTEFESLEQELSNPEIFKDQKVDNSFFFEGTEGENITPKIRIGEREIGLEKLKYNL